MLQPSELYPKVRDAIKDALFETDAYTTGDMEAIAQIAAVAALRALGYEQGGVINAVLAADRQGAEE